MTSSAEHEGPESPVVKPGDFVQVNGLTSEGGLKLNGSRGSVVRFDANKGRFEVALSCDKLTSLRPENLLVLSDDERLESLQEELIQALSSQPVRALIGQLRDGAADRAEFEERLEAALVGTRDKVYQRHGTSLAWHLQRVREAAPHDAAVRQREQKLADIVDFGGLGPSRLERGEACEVVGLTSEAGQKLNGTMGLVQSWDASSARYTVALAGGADGTKALRAENLQRVPETPLTTADAALALLRSLREAFRRPEAVRALRGLVERGADGDPAPAAALRAEVLKIQRTALEAVGLRGDAVGQRHMRQTFARFDGDDTFRAELAAADAAEGVPMQSPVVFLDVDGVLHSLRGDDIFRDSCCSLLSRVLRSTGASVILSSTWRVEAAKVAMIDDMLRRRGLPAVQGATRDTGCAREDEICGWLDEHPGVSWWIAIDDMDLQCRPTVSAARMAGHFVRTDQRTGLTPETAELALGLLAAQRQLATAHSAAGQLAVGGAAAAHRAFAQLRWDPGDGGGARALSEAELGSLVALCDACCDGKGKDVVDRAPARGLEDMAAECSVSAALAAALKAEGVHGAEALAALGAPGELEERVLSLWYDPGDGGGERSTTPPEKRALEKLYEACRAELGLPPGPYAGGGGGGRIEPPPGLRAMKLAADKLGVPSGLRAAVVELLCQTDTAGGTTGAVA